MRFALFFIAGVLSLNAGSALAQHDVTKNLRGQKWYQGTIDLTDGTSFTGPLMYNYGFGTLTYKSGENSQSLTPASVERFHFYDDSLQRKRNFYTLNYKLETDSYVRRGFFEILREYESFVVVAMSDPIEVKEKSTYAYGPRPGIMGATQVKTGSRSEFYQFETIYFLNPSEDNVEAFATSGTVTVGPNGVGRLHKKSRILHPELLKKYFSSTEINAMRKYAKQNKLDFRVKGELIRILNFGMKQKQAG